jgi:hypothetical protein
MQTFQLYYEDNRRWMDLHTAAALFQETPESLLQKYSILYPEAKIPIYSRRKQAMWRASIQEVLALQDEVEVSLHWVYAIYEKTQSESE